MSRKFLILALTALAGLAACGGGSGGGVSAPMGPDSFTAAVQQTIAGSPDDTEPASTDAISTMGVDDGEPIPVT